MARVRTWFARLYTREGFRGPVVTLLSGTAITLVVSYLTVPILTRLFTPEQFGVSDYFVMILSILITFASLRYEDAILLPESDREAGSVLWLSVLLTGVTVLLTLVAAFWRHEIAHALRVDAVAPYLWLVPPTLLLMRFGKLTEVWLSRMKAFRTITAGEVTNKIAMVSSRVAAGAATNLGAGGLIGGFFAAHVASSIYYGGVLMRRTTDGLIDALDRPSMRRAARRYRRFPIYSSPAAALNAVVARLPVLLLPVFFSLETVGYFGRAFVALAVPLSLIGTAISQVFFVHAAEAHRADRLAEFTRAVHSRLVMIGMFPTVVLIGVGPDLLEFVFGSAWRPAGVYEQVLAVWFFAGGVASPLTRLFDVLERQRTELLISLSTFLALTSALIVGGRTGSALLTMALISAAGVLIRILHIGTMMRLASVPVRDAIRPYLRYGLISIPLALPPFLLRNTLPLWAITVLAAMCGLAYLGIVIWRDRLLPTFDSDDATR